MGRFTSVKFVRKVLVTVVDLAFFFMGFYGLEHGLHEESLSEPVHGWTVTTGEVLHVRASCDRTCNYDATVQFTDPRGVLHEFAAALDSSPAAAGSQVRVDYDPKDPAEAHDLSVQMSWSFEIIATATVMVLSGLALIFVLSVYLRRRFRRVRRNGPMLPRDSSSSSLRA